MHYAERGIARFVAEHVRSLIEADAPVAALGLNPDRPRPPMLSPELSDATLLCWATASEHRHRSEPAPLIHHVLSPYEDQPPARLFPAYLGARRPPRRHHLRPHPRRPPRALPERPDHEVDLRAPAPQPRGRRPAALHLRAHPQRRHRRSSTSTPTGCRSSAAGRRRGSRPPAPGERRRRRRARARVPGLHRPYVLSVTGDEWRKNTGLLFRAFAALPAATRRAHQLVVVCSLSHDARRRWEAEIDDVRPAPRRGDPHRSGARRRASRPVPGRRPCSPSRRATRASACRSSRRPAATCPVLVASASSLPGAARRAGRRVRSRRRRRPGRAPRPRPRRRRAASTLRRAAAGTAAEHTWERVAERTLAAYSTLIGAEPASPPPGPPRHRRPVPRRPVRRRRVQRRRRPAP